MHSLPNSEACISKINDNVMKTEDVLVLNLPSFRIHSQNMQNSNDCQLVEQTFAHQTTAGKDITKSFFVKYVRTKNWLKTNQE